MSSLLKLGESKDGRAVTNDDVSYRLNGLVRPSKWPKEVVADHPGPEG
jgi:hypothetical protein